MDTDLRIPVTREQKAQIAKATREEPEGMAAWARAILLQAARARPEDDPESGRVAARFRELAAKWRAETKFVSNVSKRSLHPAYQRIIGMGEAVVPLILQDLQENGPDDWFWALSAITGENPITEGIAGNTDAMAQAWLKWGARAGYRSVSHH
jgi:hypothetical protein